MTMEITTTYNFKVKIGDAEYIFSKQAILQAEAAKRICVDLEQCIKQLTEQSY